MKRSWGWIAILTISLPLVNLGLLGLLGPAVRPLATFWFFLVCPGMAFVRLLNLPDRLAELTLAITLSLALDTVVSEMMVLNGWWSPHTGVLVLSMLTLTGVALQTVQIVRQPVDASRA